MGVVIRMGSMLVLCMGLLAPLVSSQESKADFAEQHSQLNASLLQELESLANECQRARLYLEKDRLYWMILELDPDHRVARRALRFVRNGDEWRQSFTYKPGKNRNDAQLEDYRARIERAWARYRAGMFTLIETHRLMLGLAGVEQNLEAMRELYPEDVTLRGLLGEVRLGDRWILKETLLARERRAAIASIAQSSLEKAPAPEESVATAEELELRIRWNAAEQTPEVRVLGTVPKSETVKTARVSHAVGDFFRVLFREHQRQCEDFTIYLLNGPAQGLQLTRNWPGLTQQMRADLERAQGGWLGEERRLGEWSANPLRRLDGAARQSLGLFLLDVYGINGRQGWAWEGLGLYLVHQLIGTRMTWFFEGEGYGKGATSGGLWSSMQAPTSDWLQMGEDFMAVGEFSRLRYLLGRNVNSMTDSDLLHSYVLAAYLVEGRPNQLPAILTRIGAGEHPVRVFETELGVSIDRLEERLQRWLIEMNQEELAFNLSAPSKQR